MSQVNRQEQTQSQQMLQTLSPQQVLFVKLLELPTVELEDRVRYEVLENPALEEGVDVPANDDAGMELNDFDSEEDKGVDYDVMNDYLSDDDIPDYKLQERNVSKEETVRSIPFSETKSFYDTLKEQLSERNISETTSNIVEYLIGSLDNDGLLRKNISAISDELNIYASIDCSEKDVEDALMILQDFDPAGIGARSLQECLRLQIERKMRENVNYSDSLDVALKIVNQSYEEFTKKHWEKIMRKLDIGKDVLDDAVSEIVKLNPKPGASLGESIGKNFQQIVPDFIVETTDDGEVLLNLNNRNVPEIRMNKEFKTLLEEHANNKQNQTKEAKEAVSFIKQKVESAQWFIDAIKQRQTTLIKTMQAIIELQKEFFIDGDELSIKPMILKDVAEKTGLDISTISRVSNSKYVQTNYGIYSLKSFFSDSFTTESGEEKSVREIRSIIEESIEKEDKNKPLTDEELKEVLQSEGYPIARRTVAKYREQMNIPVARLRRK